MRARPVNGQFEQLHPFPPSEEMHHHLLLREQITGFGRFLSTKVRVSSEDSGRINERSGGQASGYGMVASNVLVALSRDFVFSLCGLIFLLIRHGSVPDSLKSFL